MRVALFTIKNIMGCSYGLFSYKETLERLGHEVLTCNLPGNQVQNVDYVRMHCPNIDGLNRGHCIIASYFEYVQPWLNAIYGWDAWSKLKVPVIARFDESMDRGDLGLPGRVPELLKWAQYYSFPAAQDARKYNGQWLPFGADTTIFHRNDYAVNPVGTHEAHLTNTIKKYELGFIGTMYPERKKYLDLLIRQMPPNLTFRYGPVIVQDLSGIRERESTELLAENYRSLKCFFLLPPLSKLMVEKCWDVMASGTFLMAPRLFGEAEENLTLFKDKKEIVYYDIGFFNDNARQIIYYLQHDDEREAIARAGCELVHRKYTLEQMMEKMLAVIPTTASKVV